MVDEAQLEAGVPSLAKEAAESLGEVNGHDWKDGTDTALEVATNGRAPGRCGSDSNNSSSSSSTHSEGGKSARLLLGDARMHPDSHAVINSNGDGEICGETARVKGGRNSKLHQRGEDAVAEPIASATESGRRRPRLNIEIEAEALFQALVDRLTRDIVLEAHRLHQKGLVRAAPVSSATPASLSLLSSATTAPLSAPLHAARAQSSGKVIKQGCDIYGAPVRAASALSATPSFSLASVCLTLALSKLPYFCIYMFL